MSSIIKYICCCFFSKKSESIKDVIDPTSIEFIKKDEINEPDNGTNSENNCKSKCSFLFDSIKDDCSKNDINEVDVDLRVGIAKYSEE